MKEAVLASYNPANGELVGEVPVTPSLEIPARVEAAHRAQKAWAKLSLEERKDCIMPFGEKLGAKLDELGLLLTNEMGKPLKEAIGEIERAAIPLEEYLDEIVQALQPEEVTDKYTCSQLQYVPLGVCAAISPWNFPFYMPHWMVIPALMAGNSVILKPSEETPLIAQAYVDLLSESLPPDVLQIIHGDEEQGKALVQSDVQLIAFTGSREAGKHIMANASSHLKRLVLELGGKDPMVVLDDADIPTAAKYAVNNSFRNAGQVCVSTERIYVDEKIMSEFQNTMLEITEKRKVGPGTEEGVFVGPIINENQRQNILAQVNDAVKQGAQVVGKPKEHPNRFVIPTILSNVNHNMEIMKKETFGPVACLVPFKTIDEAIDLANDTPFGLGAAVFGKNESRAAEVASRIDAGMVGVNQGCYGATGTPWVGMKESGYGFHSGPDGHKQFAQAKVISKPLTK